MCVRMCLGCAKDVALGVKGAVTCKSLGTTALNARLYVWVYMSLFNFVEFILTALAL